MVRLPGGPLPAKREARVKPHRLAFVEGALLTMVVCMTIVMWGTPVHWDMRTVAIVVWKALTITLCCVVAFYYNDLYDFRVVQTMGDFLSRLLQSFGVAFLLLSGFYSMFPGTNIATRPFVS